MQGLKNLENDLAKMYKEQDNYFGTQEHKNTIEFFDKMDKFDNKQVESKMLKDYEVYLDLFNEVNENKVQPIEIDLSKKFFRKQKKPSKPFEFLAKGLGPHKRLQK